MKQTEKSIEVDAPVSTVYDQWTQFEEFPRFMKGVKEVRQIDDTHLHWVAEVGGSRQEWDAEIIEQQPDRAIQWRSQGGSENGGAVVFEPLDGSRTKVTLKLYYEPEGITEQLGSAFGVLGSRVEGDLENFRDFIEERGVETGGWRGEVHDGRKKNGGGGALM